MITPNEFVKIWNLLHKNLMKVVSDDNVPDILFTLDYDRKLYDNIRFVIGRVNNDKEFQESLAQPVAMKAEKNNDKIIITKESKTK